MNSGNVLVADKKVKVEFVHIVAFNSLSNNKMNKKIQDRNGSVKIVHKKTNLNLIQ